MAAATSPGCLLRGTLITFGLLFLPMAAVFAYRDIGRYWLQAVILAAVAAWFLRAGLTKDEDSWIAYVDDLGQEDDE